MHRIDDVKIGNALMPNFNIIKKLRNNAGNAAIGSKHPIGNRAHQTHFAATINKPKTA